MPVVYKCFPLFLMVFSMMVKSFFRVKKRNTQNLCLLVFEGVFCIAGFFRFACMVLRHPQQSQTRLQKRHTT